MKIHFPVCLISLLLATLILTVPELLEAQTNQNAGQASKVSAQDIIEQADALFDAGDQEAAKVLYRKAADLGSADGHFLLSYKYVLSDTESTFHLSEAAKLGHGEALGYVLDAMLFRADSLRSANPQEALDLFYQAQRVNPTLELFGREEKLRVLLMAAEPKDFDTDAFLYKYKIDEAALDNNFYGIWQLAEEASRGGRFGKPNPELVFNLVLRGGSVPAELSAAVTDSYRNWKDGRVVPFNICDYVTSGSGMGYCASKFKEQDHKKRVELLRELKSGLSLDLHPLLDEAHDAMVRFIEAKVTFEEGHGGSGRAAWILYSENEQENAWFLLLNQTRNKRAGSIDHQGFANADKTLNFTYKQVLKYLGRPNLPNYLPTVKDLKTVQRLWIPYRDNTVKIILALDPNLNEQNVLEWLTQRRTDQLKSLLSS